MDTTMTCLGGTLTRVGKNQWSWIDGTPAAGVRDETINSYNFRVNGGMVEVPVWTAKANADLAWCMDYPRHPTRRGLILVPLAEWDSRSQDPIGCSWPAEIEAAIFDRAQELGWEWPGRVRTGIDDSAPVHDTPTAGHVRDGY